MPAPDGLFYVYQIALRTVHEPFESDQIGALDSVVFNGYVTSVDRRTGLTSTACILSLQTIREEFLKMDLRRFEYTHFARSHVHRTIRCHLLLMCKQQGRTGGIAAELYVDSGVGGVPGRDDRE